MGRHLRRLRDGQLFLRLGFSTMRDYAAERLGMGVRTAQELIRVDEALERLPRTASAWLAGEITAGHVRIISRVAAPESEGMWLGRARRMDVRALARAAATARERARGDGAAPVVPSRGAGPSAAGEASTGALALRDGPALLDDLPELAPLSVRAPAWILRWWRDTAALVRRLAGSPLPPGACLEAVLAESADLPGLAGTGRLRLDEAADPSMALRPAPGGPGGAVPGSPRRPPAVFPPPASRGSGLAAEDPAVTARRVDGRLRRLICARQRAEADLADHLVCLRASGGHLVEGFSSLKSYARERLGLSPRMVDSLVSLHRTLAGLPDLRRAFLSGRLTLRQALLVGKVATKATTAPWVRRAERVTLRRLEDEVEYWELLRQERPGVWEALRGRPLPVDIALAPGKAPRLREGAAEAGPEDGATASGPGGVDAPGPEGPVAARRVAPDLLGAGGSGAAEGSDEEGPSHTSAPGPNGHADAGLDESDLRDSGGLGAAEGSVGEGPLSHASAPPVDLDARAFMRLLSASEEAVPLPWRLGTLRMRVEPAVRRRYSETIAALRSMSEEPIEEWEAFALVLRRFWDVWDNRMTRAQRRRYKALERDGGRCAVPGCRTIGTGQVQEHHIIFRSAGGPLKDLENLAPLCNVHHGPVLHSGIIRCRGAAPDNLVWEMGVAEGLPWFLTFLGDMRTGGAAM